MNRRAAAALAALLAAAAGARAQTPFALAGPGADVSVGSARATGRGGWGMAEGDTLAPNFLNPASLADLTQLAVMFSGYGETRASSGGGLERRSNRTLLPEIRLAVPLRERRLALHTGFSTRRSMQYRSQVDLAWPAGEDTMRGYERAIREGTLFRVPLGLAWRAAPWLAVGAEVDLVRGPLREELAQVVVDTFGPVLPNTLIQEDVISGVATTFSVLLAPRGPVSLGASWSPAHDADLDRTVSLGGVADRSERTFHLHLPDEARAGLQVRLGSWTVGADARLARWSRFRGLPEWEGITRDEWTFAAGVERPLRFRPLGRGHDLPLRAGYLWRRWAHEVGGEPIDERVWSAGTGFPLSRRLGMIDVALSYFVAGDEGRNGWADRGWRLGLSVTGLERLLF